MHTSFGRWLGAFFNDISDKFNWITGLSALTGALIGWLFGELNGLFFALVTLIIIDYISGVIAAGCEGKLDSRVGFKGIGKKVMMLIVVGLMHVLDAQIFQHGDVLRDMVALFLVANESLSILENASRLGIPVPAKVQDMLKQLGREPDRGGDCLKNKEDKND